MPLSAGVNVSAQHTHLTERKPCRCEASVSFSARELKRSSKDVELESAAAGTSKSLEISFCLLVKKEFTTAESLASSFHTRGRSVIAYRERKK